MQCIVLLDDYRTEDYIEEMRVLLKIHPDIPLYWRQVQRKLNKMASDSREFTEMAFWLRVGEAVRVVMALQEKHTAANPIGPQRLWDFIKQAMGTLNKVKRQRNYNAHDLFPSRENVEDVRLALAQLAKILAQEHNLTSHEADLLKSELTSNNIIQQVQDYWRYDDSFQHNAQLPTGFMV